MAKAKKEENSKTFKFNFKCPMCGKRTGIHKVSAEAEVLHRLDFITEVDVGGYPHYDPWVQYVGWRAGSIIGASQDKDRYECGACGFRIGADLEEVVCWLRDHEMLKEK